MSPALLVAMAVAASAAAGIVLEARDFAFEPSDLTVTPAAKVTVHNAGQAPHTVTARGGLFQVEVPSGETGTFLAPQTAGIFPFFCAYHDWMRGNLTVDPQASSSAAPETSSHKIAGFGAPALVAGGLVAAAAASSRKPFR